jgi:serine/threonine-protein kinase
LQAYVTGFAAMTRPGRQSLEAGLRSLRAAVDREPGFALAHCRLAYCYMLLGVFGIRSPLQMYPRALASAQRAMAIDARSFDAEAQVAHIKGLCGDHAAAEEGLRQTLTKDPANFIGHHLMGLWLLRKGDFDEATASMRRAQQVQPLAPAASANIGMTYYYARRYRKAIEQLQMTLDMDPTFDHARSYLGRTYLRLGQTNRAIEQFQRRGGATYCSAGDVPSALALAGRRAEALGCLHALLESTSYVSAYDIASVYAALDDTTAALQWLDRALEMTFIDVDPAFDELRHNTRFQEVVASFPNRMRGLAERTLGSSSSTGRNSLEELP